MTKYRKGSLFNLNSNFHHDMVSMFKEGQKAIYFANNISKILLEECDAGVQAELHRLLHDTI